MEPDELVEAKAADADRWPKKRRDHCRHRQRKRCEQEDWVQDAGAESPHNPDSDPTNLDVLDHRDLAFCGPQSSGERNARQFRTLVRGRKPHSSLENAVSGSALPNPFLPIREKHRLGDAE